MKISKTALALLFSSGASFSLSIKSLEIYREYRNNYPTCCLPESCPPPPLPLGFEYWGELGFILLLLSFCLLALAFAFLKRDNANINVLHITPTN